MLTEAEERQMIELVDKMGSQWTARLYNKFASKFALTAIEIVFLKRDNRGDILVLLTRHPHGDSYYPDQWHSPGTMLRASDYQEETEKNLGIPEFDGFRKTFERLEKSELGVRFMGRPRHIKSIFHFTPRGSETALIFLCELEGEPKSGKFFKVNELPHDLIEHHYRIISMAVEAFDKGL